MKPCPSFKKQIALLAAKSLSDDESRHAQDHVRECPECRQYWHDVSRLCGEHFELAGELPTVEADQRFHQRLTVRIKNCEAIQESRPTIARVLVGALALPRRKPAFAVAAALLTAIALFFFCSGRKVEAPVAKSILPQARAAVAGNVTPQPTLMSYRLAASKSFEELDALLAKDADRLLPATPLLTASARRELSLDE